MGEGPPKTKNPRERIDRLMAYVESLGEVSRDYKDKLIKIIHMSRGIKIKDYQIRELLDGLVKLVQTENEQEMRIDSLLDPEELIAIYAEVEDIIDQGERLEREKKQTGTDLDDILRKPN